MWCRMERKIKGGKMIQRKKLKGKKSKSDREENKFFLYVIWYFKKLKNKMCLKL